MFSVFQNNSSNVQRKVKTRRSFPTLNHIEAINIDDMVTEYTLQT